MKVIIAGSRTITDPNILVEAIYQSGICGEITEVVCGMSKGVDYLGWEWSKKWGFPVKCFGASWHTHGKAAGPIRNRLMTKYADALILIWDGKSKGSANIKKEARSKGLRIFELIIGYDFDEQVIVAEPSQTEVFR